MQIKDIIHFLESWAHPSLQENYDNSGLILGDSSDEVDQALITLDVTEEVVDEAVKMNAKLIIAHHPLIFTGIKRIGKSHWLDKCVRKAIVNDIAIYAIHTNLDNIRTGVNAKIAEKLALTNLSILKPKKGTLNKLTIFVPIESKQPVLDALYTAGAGNVGNYDHCSFQITGEGTFRPNEVANPTIGKSNRDETVEEVRIEVIVSQYKKGQVLAAMRESHPYEEVAYYLSELVNLNQDIGSGMIGELQNSMAVPDFMNFLKESMQLDKLKHTAYTSKEVKRVAFCGGAGRFLLETAISQQADVFISSDFKYHDYFEANGQVIIADIGHYESEVFTKELMHEVLTEKFSNFAFRLSRVNTNPIKYL